MTYRRKLLPDESGRLDYIESEGGFDKDDSNTSTFIWLLLTPYGSCAVAPEAGNRSFSEGKLTAGSPRAFERYCQLAVEPMVRDGRISDPSFDVTISDGSVSVTASFFDNILGEQKRIEGVRIT